MHSDLMPHLTEQHPEADLLRRPNGLLLGVLGDVDHFPGTG